MGNSQSTPTLPEPEHAPAPMMENLGNPMPDFNVMFNEGVPKMMQIADDMHRMTDYIMDLRNMTIGLVVLSVIGMLIFLLLKWRNDRRHSRGKLVFNNDISEV